MAYKYHGKFYFISWLLFFITSIVLVGYALFLPAPAAAGHYDCSKIYPKFEHYIGQYMVENGFNSGSKKSTEYSQETAKIIESAPDCFPESLKLIAIQILGH